MASNRPTKAFNPITGMLIGMCAGLMAILTTHHGASPLTKVGIVAIDVVGFGLFFIMLRAIARQLPINGLFTTIAAFVLSIVLLSKGQDWAGWLVYVGPLMLIVAVLIDCSLGRLLSTPPAVKPQAASRPQVIHDITTAPRRRS